MPWLYHPFLMLIAKSTDSQLVNQVEFVKAEGAMLRRRINKQIRLSPKEKRLLVKLG
jgi:hypothetical protein